jgi:hypothetical protein
MKAIISFVMLMLFAIITANAQPKSGLYLSVNPLAVLEPQSALGAGVGSFQRLFRNFY